MNNIIEELYKEYYEKKNFSGAGLVKKGNEIVFANAYGYAHRGFEIKNTIYTMFDTASITKLFTSVAILQLVDKGLLSIKDKITDIIDLKETKIPNDVNIFHLLTYTSGIADDADEEAGENYEDLFIDKPNYAIRNCSDFLPQFAYKDPIFKAGANVRYNNCAFVLLGLALEKLTGENYRDYVTKNVFQACGMKNTAFCSKDDSDAKMAEGYYGVYDENNNIVGWHKNIYSYPPIGTPDGGAFTTVCDLDIFIRGLIGGNLLSKEMTKEIMKPQSNIELNHYLGRKVTGFGFYFIHDNDGKVIRVSKEGQNAGVAAMFAYYPYSDTTNIILGNQTCNVWELHRKVEEEILK